MNAAIANVVPMPGSRAEVARRREIALDMRSQRFAVAEIAIFLGISERAVDRLLEVACMAEKVAAPMPHHDLSDLGSFAAGMRFHAWAVQQRVALTADRVMDQFRCSRATAHRWVAAFRAVRGEP